MNFLRKTGHGFSLMQLCPTIRSHFTLPKERWQNDTQGMTKQKIFLKWH
ncbi:hypothetical protein LBBP_02323 [Leptospira borgpetersenii serovar Ballum]|uniref:Uncharacterized protein n=1 Tax=Leptospira borgpetersenii serovar Ballum TaxID=280505 RepID=A0A0S2ISD3_LEPBO|nr:hypothetical protein LBBP_02323 [Leptospira borgpetersenii serovar Ballum]